MTLGAELQTRLLESLATELSFYKSRGIINKDEERLLSETFTKTLAVTSKVMPLDLAERSLDISVQEDKSLSERVEKTVEDVMVKLGLKATYDDSPWDGDASNWKSAESYCSCCLIDLNEGSGPKTKENCKLPYKKEGNSSINRNALRAMASGGRGLPALKGVPRDQVVKAANFMIRHWKSAFDQPAPANIYRLAGKKPPADSKQESKVKLIKDKQGQWWMVGMYSNRWMDREQEIISESAHKEYADWLNKSGFKPPVIVYHLPKLPQGFWEVVWEKYGTNIEKLNSIVAKVYEKTSIGYVDKIINLNGFAISLAKIREDKVEAAQALAERDDLGMSHGFLVYEVSNPKDFRNYEDTINIIDKYRSFEMSLLLRERAANFGTAPFFVEEKVSYSEEDLEVIRKVLPDDLVAALDENSGKAAGMLDQILEMKDFFGHDQPEVEEKVDESSETEDEEEENMEQETKNVQEEVKVEEEVQAEEVQGESVEQTEEAKDVPDENAVVAKVLKELNIEDLQGVLKTIVDQQKTLVAEIEALKRSNEQYAHEIKALKQTEDEKIAAAVSPGINWAGVGYSPSKAEDNAVPEEVTKDLQQAAAGGLTGDATIDHFFNSINMHQ